MRLLKLPPKRSQTAPGDGPLAAVSPELSDLSAADVEVSQEGKTERPANVIGEIAYNRQL